MYVARLARWHHFYYMMAVLTSLLKDNHRTSFASSVVHCTAIHTKIWFCHSGQSQNVPSFRKFKSGWTITTSPCEVVVHRVGSYNAAGEHGGTSKQHSLWRCCKLNLWDHWYRKWMTMYTICQSNNHLTISVLYFEILRGQNSAGMGTEAKVHGNFGLRFCISASIATYNVVWGCLT